MFIYNKILKLWDEKGLTIMFTGIIIFFIVYWFLFTSENKEGTYNKISLKNLFKQEISYKHPQNNTILPNFVRKSPVPKCSKGEAECRRVLEKIFNVPFPNIRPNIIKNTVTGENLELDMYNHDLKLACEYNGQQHYLPSAWKNKKEFKKSKLRDKEKKQKCKEHNINLIVIKYNQWDGLPKSFLEIIKKHTKINLDQEKKFWKKLYKEDIYKDILKEIKRSRGSLQTY